ncbi:MAG TPA: S8 family serine peptidase [Thermoanaerobaculia bacterium]|nr:S8 family serine peptidase [Thermoanaerobaculia bacterium]
MFRVPQQLLRLTIAIVLALMTAAAGLAAPWGPPDRPAEVSAAVTAPLTGLDASAGPVPVMVQLFDPPAAVDYAMALADQSVSREQALANARSAAKAKIAQLEPRHEQLAAALAAAPIHAQEMFRLKKALNAIAVMVDRAKLDQIRMLPGVKSADVIPLEYPTNKTSVPFIGAPKAWGNTLGLGGSVTGAGVKIGIIDTGIDYQHPDFGGSGHNYPKNDRVTNKNGLFPTAKVIGGTDLVGDDYTGGNTPKPDPNPTDCNGHGTHVAGTAAGFGVNADGTTFTGPYGPSTPFGSLRIGPGVAPLASLFAIRIFGCGGGSAVVAQGIEFAMDPSGKGDFSDHLDVINMSLGSPNGGLNSFTAQAADAAASVGVIVAAASGNNGDTYFVTSSPAAADFAISAAASVDPGVLATGKLHVNSPGSIAGDYAAVPAAFGPSPSGQTADLVLAAPNDGCAPLTNAAAVSGKIVVIDRGTCTFVVKAQNAQDAGAIAAVVVNNVAGPAGVMGGSGTFTIPSVMISQADGATIKAQLPGVNATLPAPPTLADTLAGFSSRGPRGLGGPIGLKPDIAAPGLFIPSAQSGMSCAALPGGSGITGGGCLVPSPSGFIPGGQVLTISGTSMATPHIAGTMALLRQLHPDWSVEELKALVMNGAVHDVTVGPNGTGGRYGVGRIGAGRVDVAVSAQNQVTAFNDDDPGHVSLTFDSAAVHTLDQIKELRVVNHGSQAATFSLGFDNITPAPGVSYSLSGSSSTLVVAPNSAVQVPVQMHADASKMDHVADATVAPTQAAPAPLAALGPLPRQVLTEAGSYLTFGQGGQTKMRVPLYAAIAPASAMSGTFPIATGGATVGATAVALSGIGVCTGTTSAGACKGTFPKTEASLVTPFELQVAHALDPTIPAYANLQYAGVAYDAADSALLFGVSTWGPWMSPTDVAFNIYIDTQNNGTYDKVLFNSNPGTMASQLFGRVADGQDTFLTGLFNAAKSTISTQFFVNLFPASAVDTRTFNNNVMFLAVSLKSLGLKGTAFRWRVETCPGFLPLCTPQANFRYDGADGPFTWDYAAQGLDFGGAFVDFDLNGDSLPVNFNVPNFVAQGSLGALLLHHHNSGGTQAQALPLAGARFADLAVTSSVSPAVVKPAVNVPVTLTVTVSNGGPNRARQVLVSDGLPNALTYVSDDSKGAYDPNTGLWSVGQLAVGASATLHIHATVTSSGEIVNTAQIAFSKPIDPNPENDISNLTINAPRLADLAVTASAGASSVHPGKPVSFQVGLKNLGGDPSYNPRVHVTLGGAKYDPAAITVSQGKFDPTSGFWQLGSVGNGATETLKFTVTPHGASSVGISASVTASTPDPNTKNNQASVKVTVQ